jgi:flagellar protein FliS
MPAPSKPWKSYQQIATQTAPPGQLVLMLYEGTVRFLERALAGFDIDDPARCNEMISNNIIRAQNIIFELNVTLNMQQGGEVATTLRRLYDYMDRRLVEANLKKDKSAVEETLRRAIVLRDAWSQMLNNQGSNPTEDAKASALVAA